MHLYFFLLVIVSLSCGSLPPVDTSLAQASLATLCMVTALTLLCHIAGRICAQQIRNENLDPLIGAELLERQMTAFRWLGLGIVILCLGGFGLASASGKAPILNHSFFLQALILLAPGLTITIATWSAQQYYRSLTGLADRKPKTHISRLWQRFRGTVAWLVVPILLLLGMTDLIGTLPIDEGVAAAITVVGMLLFVPLGLPWLIRHLFKTSKLDVSTETWIQQILTATGLRSTRILRWHTGHQSFNAMVAGFIPPLRTLLISDRLIDELPRDQVAMVVLHEAAHLRRFHVPIRMLTIVPAWLLGGFITRLANGDSWGILAGSIVAIALTMIGLRIAAFRTELDADLHACRMAVDMADQIECVPASYQQASAALSSALLRITLEHPGARKATWLHPSVSERIASMQRHGVLQTTPNIPTNAIAQ